MNSLDKLKLANFMEELSVIFTKSAKTASEQNGMPELWGACIAMAYTDIAKVFSEFSKKRGNRGLNEVFEKVLRTYKEEDIRHNDIISAIVEGAEKTTKKTIIENHEVSRLQANLEKCAVILQKKLYHYIEYEDYDTDEDDFDSLDEDIINDETILNLAKKASEKAHSDFCKFTEDTLKSYIDTSLSHPFSCH